MRLASIVIVLAFTTVAHANPKERAKQIVNAQVAAMPHVFDDKGPTNDVKFAATFAPDAVVVVTGIGAVQPKSNGLSLQGAIVGHFHGFIKAAKLVTLTAGGNDKVVWIGAEIEAVIEEANSANFGNPDGKVVPPTTRKSMLRLTELVVPDGAKWKVIAAQLSTLDPIKREKDPLSAIEVPTSAGLLSKWAASPKDLSGILFNKPSTFAFGTDKTERGIGGAAAKKLVDSWATLTFQLDGKPREVRTATYGFVQANINLVKPGGPPYRMRVFLIGIPDSNGAWEAVAVHYGAP